MDIKQPPSEFMEEIRKLVKYLNEIELDPSNSCYVIRETCSDQLDQVIKICEQQMNQTAPLFRVFICEFEILSKEIINDIKSKTENYTKQLSLYELKQGLKELLRSLEVNIYLKDQVKNIRLNNLPPEFVAVSKYTNIGKNLKDSAEVVEIIQELAKLRSETADETSHYASILGPSSMGKTQTAFTLLCEFAFHF